MEADELIDALIAEGCTQAWIYRDDRPTDDDDIWITEFLVLDINGNIIARKFYPPACNGWSLVIWALRPPLFPIPGNVMDLNLKNRADAIAVAGLFGSM